MKRVDRWPWIFASMLFALPVQRVEAHAGPQVRGIFLGGESQPDMLLSNRGLIFGKPQGGGWALMCNEALGVSTNEIPDIARLPDGRLVAASSSGLRQTTDGGCNWTGIEPYAKANTPSLAQDPKQPNRLYLSTYGSGLSALRVSEDGGATWQQLMAAEDTDFLRYIRVAPNQPEQLYVRSLSYSGSTFSYATWHSGDAGKTWEKSPTSIAETETDFVLYAVSPSDPAFIVGKAEAENPMLVAERVLVSHDAGKTWQSPISAHVINGVAFSADGKTLWIASDDGLFTSSDAGKTFAQIGSAAYVDAVREMGGQLLVGGYWRGVAAGMPGIGVSSDGGASLQQWMGLTDVVRPLACDPKSMTAVTCETLWPDWEREILGVVTTGAAGMAAPAAGSGGSVAALAGSGGGPAAGSGEPLAGEMKAGSSGCSAVAGGASDWWLLLASGWLVRRARRKASARAGR